MAPLTARTSSPPAAELGSRLRETRLHLGLTQGQVADRCHLHRTYVGSVERGERNLSLTNIVGPAAAVGVDPGELVAGVQEQGGRRQA